MLVYFFIFAVSVGGISVIALKHKEEINKFNFAIFMEDILKQIHQWWYSEAHPHFLKLLEKFLRKSRIRVLKVENFLFRKARAVRNISERNENGMGNESNTEKTTE